MRQDVDEARALLRTGGSSWRRGELLDFLQDGLSSGVVAESEGRILGVLLFRIRCDEVVLPIVALVVDADYRRRGIGSLLLHGLGRNLSSIDSGRIEALVSERDLAAQLFLRANGFRVVRIDRQALDGDDGYLFQRAYMKAAAASAPARGRAGRKR
jgi:ribosomal protein S18 acetylase RimI-like enzyme